MGKAWTSIGAGEEFHRAHVLDVSGTEFLSCRTENKEAELSKLLEEVLFSPKGSCGRPTSPGAARRCCWRCFGGEARG